jgi:glyoxylase-like metal-dependent hydrolase (beta-lactamase superfamily II)
MENNISLEVYNGIEASVNAYLFYDTESSVLVDCLRNSTEAKELARLIKSKNKTLTHILITHGHPDHYIGMNVMKQEFPDVQIVVARQEIKNDIIRFSEWMESVGWLEKEPSMKPKSSTNTAGFDYGNNISVLRAKELKLAKGARLQINSDYAGAECEHLTTIYSEDLNAFFTGDFCYNHVHPWLAVSKENIFHWKRQLDNFKREHSILQPIIYPGHGKFTDISLFDEVKKYIEDFEETIAISKNRNDAMERMRAIYPDYQEADFLLLNSVNALIPE